jgi:hypothetical protein
VVPAPALTAAGALALAALLAGCGSDGGGDPAAFCAAVDDLRGNDPFADLAVASPGEMRDAFAALADGARRIDDAAPESAEVQARRYAEAVEVLRDELAGAGYDPRQVDVQRYGDGVDDYTAAATSLGNAADATCDG